MKAANTIEAAPQRDRPKNSSAEEPITARIRRRTRASNQMSDSAVETDAESETRPLAPLAVAQNPHGNSPLTFQERITLERQQTPEREGESPG